MLRHAARLLVAGLAGLALLMPARASGTALEGSGVPDIGRIPIGTCNIQGSTVDPGLQVLVLVRYVWSGCANVTGVHLQLQAYSTRTLAKVGDATMKTSQDNVYVHHLPLDAIHHRVFVVWDDISAPSPGVIEEYSLADLLSGRPSIAPDATSSYPTSGTSLASGPDGSGAAPTTDPAAAAGDQQLEPTAARYWPATNTLYMAMTEVETFSLGSSDTSVHGPAANDTYVMAEDATSGAQLWALRLTLCTGMAQGASGVYDTPLLVRSVPGGVDVAVSCLATRGVVGTSGQGAGTILTYDVPLGRNGLPDSSAVSYQLGRVNAEGGAVDDATGRIFIASPPSIAASQAGGATASGPSAVVYDAAHRAYVGAPTMGGPDIAFGGFAVADAAGRFYAVGPDGVTVVDAAPTPLGQGVLSPTYHCNANLAIADPVQRRLFVWPVQGCTAADPGIAPKGDHLDVLQDEYPSVSPPPPPDPDSLTTQVAEQSGVTDAQYTGAADATGSRIRLIGGESGLVDGLVVGNYSYALGQAGQNDPIADYSTRELDTAVISSTSLTNYQAQAGSVAATADDVTATDIKTHTGQDWPIAAVACSDPGTPTDQVSYAGNTGSSTSCAFQKEAEANSHAESVGLLLTLAGQSGPAPFDLGRAVSTTSVKLDSSGLVSDARSVVTGIDIGAVRIDAVTSEAKCQAHGRTGTASCTYTRLLNGLSINGSPQQGCVQMAGPNGESDTCQTLLDELNSIEPGYLVFSTPLPDGRPGFVNGSPGGYQAIVQRELYQHLQASVVNYDDSTDLPGLQILYIQDSNTQPSRVDVQLANVEAETHYGITLLYPGCASCAAAPPALPAVSIPTPAPLHLTGKPGAVGQSGGLAGILQKVWKGFSLLLRSPAAALAATALLLMLVAPLLMGMRRRRLELLVQEVAS